MQEPENQSGDLQDPAEPKRVDQDVETEDNAAADAAPVDGTVTTEETVQESETVVDDGPDEEQVRREAARTQTTKETHNPGLGNNS